MTAARMWPHFAGTIPVYSLVRRTGALLICLASGLGECQRGGLVATGAPTSAPGPYGSAPGYILFAPLLSTTTYLIDKLRRVVHAWESAHPPGCTVFLLDDGHLRRAERRPDRSIFGAGGEGGRIVELD